MPSSGPSDPDREAPASAIKVVVVDENQHDVEAAVDALRAAGKLVEHIVASDPAQLRSVLESFEPDVILGDFGAVGGDPAADLAAVRQLRAGTPAVYLTGTIDEERVVVALHSGAVDYVRKTNLARLPVVVDRALQEASERKRLEAELAQAQARVRHHTQRLESLCRIAGDSALRGSAQISAMLREAARSLRPPLQFNGIISRIVGSTLLVLDVQPEREPGSAGATLYPTGTLLPIAETIATHGSRTHCWDDIMGLEERPPTAAKLGWRSIVTTQFSVGSERYVLTFGSESPAHFDLQDIAYVELLAASFAGQLERDSLDSLLHESELRARLHAARLEVLWRIANNPTLRGKELWLAMLRESTKAIRPGQLYQGVFARLEGANVVLEAVEAPGADDDAEKITAAIGAVTPLAETIIAQVIEAGGTYAWDDFQAAGVRTRGPLVRGWRSAIATIFSAGGTTYNLTFASREATQHPFGPSEFAYIQILASFFSSHLQEAWQYERIAYQQSHDVLTGLPNRSRFRSLARTAALAKRSFAIVLIDIDALREVNESYGYLIGDAMLVEVAAALQARASTDEIVGRVAGDVFGVYIDGAPANRTVRDRALHLSDTFSHSFSTGDREGREFVALTASLGVAIAPQDGETIDEVLSHADAALVAAKERGPGNLVMFSAGMEGDLRRRAALRTELLAAIADDEFELYFQPHVDLRSGEVGGCEALIRWHHPTRGLLLPAEFIPFAEQNGLITGIDEWVMRAAFAAANDFSVIWPTLRLYFNLCGRQAGDPAVVRAFTAAARAGIRIKNLGVEITETDAMRDVPATRRVCRALRRLGVSVAIDDFGVGYSSLASLNVLPVDVVKIDQSFIIGAAADPRKASIAETIMEISQRFGFVSLAEGVEDAADAAWLRRTSCRLAQGYLFARPLTFVAFKSWLDERGLRRLGTLSAGELHALPFGAIVVDLDGTILSYNTYEAKLSQLDATRVVGKNFFRHVAPCTGVKEFEGRMRTFAGTPELVSASFRYFFPFAHGDVDVDVRFVKRPGDTMLIVIERFDEATPSALMTTARERR